MISVWERGARGARGGAASDAGRGALSKKGEFRGCPRFYLGWPGMGRGRVWLPVLVFRFCNSPLHGLPSTRCTNIVVTWRFFFSCTLAIAGYGYCMPWPSSVAPLHPRAPFLGPGARVHNCTDQTPWATETAPSAARSNARYGRRLAGGGRRLEWWPTR